jgi:hypothetical protein
MTKIVTQKPTEVARTTTVRLRELSATEDLRDKTVLTDILELPIFTPGYLFVSPGEHYSHPAGELRHRLDFLLDLQDLDEPYLFWMALRYNRWVPIDHLAAAGRGDPIRIRVNVCNYPERFKSVYVQYAKSLRSDTSLFSPIGSTRFVRLSSQPPIDYYENKIDYPDDPIAQYQLFRIRSQLSDEGRRLFDAYLTRELTPWEHHFDQPGRGHEFSENVDLLSVASRPVGDSLLVVFALRVTGEVKEDFRVFLHIYPGEAGHAFSNFDFSPSVPTRSWQAGEIVILSRRLPQTLCISRIHFGLFNDKGRMGKGFGCQFDSTSVLVP